RLYRELESHPERLFAPDLLQYFLGESARVAAVVSRCVAPEESSNWLDLAENHFLSGVNPEPQLARVLFTRLTLLYAIARCDLVIEKGPYLDSVFSSLGMEEDRVKCRIVWAGSLKLVGRCEEALEVLEPVRWERLQIRPALFGWVLLQLGDIHQMCGDHERALQDLLEAARLLREGKQFTGLADVYSMVSCLYRAHGRMDEAVSLLETARQDHARLGMKWPEAYHRILIAETYLAMGRPREAEIEVRAALPILEEQGMLAETVIAVNLLREAVRQRKLDPADIRESSKPKT
ncbi:MAG: tetratricopeptide repeat protein, partial [Acidobacteriota bacterium]|nr:tetratricopeptide repeat protein [Acidobacteriota bacterium]